MPLYITRPRRDEVRIGRGLPSDNVLNYLIAEPIGTGSEISEKSLTYSFLINIRNWKSI